MKKLLLLLVLFCAKVTLAQPPAYDDLLMYYTDKQWEKLIKSAEKYTNKEETARDPQAHLWLAKGLYEMSQSGNTDEAYKNAYKDAIGAMGKFTKLDKTGAVKSENMAFFEKFKFSVSEVISNEMSNPKKASGWVIKYYKFEVNYVGAKYLEGACKFLSGDKTGANVFWKEAETQLTAIINSGAAPFAVVDSSPEEGEDGYSEADKAIFKLGILKTVECYMASKQPDKAKALLGKVAKWYEKDEEFKAVYDDIVN